VGRWAVESGGVEDPAPYLHVLKWQPSRHGNRIGKGDEAFVSGDPAVASCVMLCMRGRLGVTGASCCFGFSASKLAGVKKRTCMH
jgi:hypothetical protein